MALWCWKTSRPLRVSDIDLQASSMMRHIIQSSLLMITSVNLFVHWLYKQQIPYDLLENDWEHILELNDNTTATTQARLPICIKAYMLGEPLVAPVFLQHVNDRFTQFYFQHKGYLAVERYPLIELASNDIPLNCIVLQLLVNHHCTHSWFWGPTEGEENQVDMSALEDSFPRRFLLRTMKRQKELDTMTAGERLAVRCYREHASDGEKSNCKAKHMRYDALVDFGFFD
jgi:hypothetical protein